MSAILPWRPPETCEQVIRHLANGKCVALPTESTYELVASALSPTGVNRLAELGAPAIVLGAYGDHLDWLPHLCGASARLVRKLGPGPYFLSAGAGFRAGLWNRLPIDVQPIFVQKGRLAVRWPDHPIWNELRRAPFPLASVSLSATRIAAEAERVAGDRAVCIVDNDARSSGVLPTWIQVEGRRFSVLREGGLTREHLDEYALCRVLFICTGNTCRSPLAQGLCEKLLADRLRCRTSELRERGFLVQSAGLAAMMGSEASHEAVAVAAEFGADLGQHRSTTATMDLLQWADYVFAMTSGHWYTLLSVAGPGLAQPRMLSPEFEDIADPIGGAIANYRTCARQILDCLEKRLPELLES